MKANRIVLVVWIMLSVGATWAEDRSAVPRIEGDIRVDGVLDEAQWSDALVIDVAYEVDPGENIPAPVRTELLLMHDADALYAAFRAYDPNPEEIRAHLRDRDDVGTDDWVALVLDTFNDERWSYDVVVNPLNVQTDFIEQRNAGNVEWDAIWDSAARITDWGWLAEIAVPFSSLRFQRTEEPQVWSIDAVRSYPRTIRHHLGAFPRDRSNSCYLCQAIKVEGFAGVRPGRSLEITPTLTAVRTDRREPFPDGDLGSGDVEIDAGLTARWGITPNLTLSGTINPDFSQVEADSLQLDVNEPFALFFEEKRPFFMEGMQLFETPLDVVYTRTVRDPSWGAKLTGREGNHVMGAFVASDEVTNILIPGAQGSRGLSLDLASTVGVLRYAYEADSKLTLGTLGTFRKGDGYSNMVAGFDGEWRPSDSDRFTWQVMRSSTEYPAEVADELDQPSDPMSDWAARFSYVHDARNLDHWLVYHDIGRDFRADLGFMPRVDYRETIVGTDYTWYPDGGQTWFKQMALSGELVHREQHNKDLLLDQAYVGFVYTGPLEMHSVAQIRRGREGYGGRQFDLFKLFLHHCMNPDPHSHIWVNAWLGDQVDYVNVQKADRLQLEPGISYGFGRHLRLEAWCTWERMKVGSERLYTATIPQASLSYQFNPRAFLRTIVQYVNYDHNTALYTDARDATFERMFTQVLFSYKLNPQTVFFLGYSDNAFGGETYDLTKADRTLFLKIGYAWNV